MKIRFILMLALAFSLSGLSHAQKIKVQSGKLSALKGVEQMKIVYDYSELAVGKFDKESDYIDKKVKELNEDEAGSGDTWKEAWFNDRPTRFEPKFEELWAKYSPIEAGKDLDAEVTMYVYTTFVEPGYNVMVSRKPASISLMVAFVRGSEELAVVQVLNAPGGGAAGYDFDTGYRIQEAYAKAGKSLGRYLDKNL